MSIKLWFKKYLLKNLDTPQSAVSEITANEATPYKEKKPEAEVPETPETKPLRKRPAPKPKLKKADLIKSIAEAADISPSKANLVLKIFSTEITNSLQKGDTVSLPNFGAFHVKDRSSRSGRNPSTGEQMEIKASRTACFKASKTLKNAVNEVRPS